MKRQVLAERTYTVRLYFAEPDGLKPGERVFHVRLQGKQALSNFDIAKAAGGADRTIFREFKGIKVKDNLTIDLSPSNIAKARPPVLCGVEILAEGW